MEYSGKLDTYAGYEPVLLFSNAGSIPQNVHIKLHPVYSNPKKIRGIKCETLVF